MFYLNKIKIPPRESSEIIVLTTATAAVTVDWGTGRTVFTTATAAVFVDW